MARNPKIAIFDLDDTLYSYNASHTHAQSELSNFLSKSLNISFPDVEKGLSEARDKVKSRVADQGSSHSRLLYISEYLRGTIGSSKPNLVLQAEQLYWQKYFIQMKLYDGVVELLTNLRLHGCKLILVTDLTLQIQLKKLVWLRLDSFFDIVIASEETAGDKHTGYPEELLNTLSSPVDQPVWTIGDKSHDHLWKDQSIFFNKTESGKLRQQDDKIFEFSDFRDLVALLKD